MAMADHCNYVVQLTETCRLIAEEMRLDSDRWKLVYQSRSGRPTDPWLEPDILDHLRWLKETGRSSVVIAPIGFLSDHIEILFDLDEQARDECHRLGLTMTRSATVGTHPRFIAMIRELIQERIGQLSERRALGALGTIPDVCPVDCCLYEKG
jgi:ferrochelatase